MPSYSEIKVLPYSINTLFELVADIEKYPEFVPWCVGARILSKNGNNLKADLSVGFMGFKEIFTSNVILTSPLSGIAKIDVVLEKGPFSYLKNHWHFKSIGENDTEVNFQIDFEFRSKLFSKMIGHLFESAQRKMIKAFEERANSCYSLRKSSGAIGDSGSSLLKR